MPSAINKKLIHRAEGLGLARSFFAKKGLIEVDCLALCKSASIDTNIDLFSVASPIHGRRFLFSSPEYALKRLICEGSGDLYYLGHVWRHEESGRNHSPEFLIAEWYRRGITFREMMEETVEFAELFIGKKPHSYITYREAFLTYANIDPFTASHQALRTACKGFDGYPIDSSSVDDLLNLLLALKIETRFDPEAITVLYHYPASQAALARKTVEGGHTVAERFELYCGGLELGNGYHELADAKEQKERFFEDNELRSSLGKEKYPIDDNFLKALKQGLPDCCGVAVGVDRLLMLRHKAQSIGDVMPLPWEIA